MSSDKNKGKSLWGPPTWHMIHTFAASSEKNVDSYVRFLNLLTDLLPCDMCKNNLKKKMGKYPPEDYVHQGVETTFWYSYIVHDLANQDINQYYNLSGDEKKVSPVYEDAQNYYFRGISHIDFWEEQLWKMLRFFAATLKSSVNSKFRDMVYTVADLVPDERYGNNMKHYLKMNNISPYLRNNDDAYFYIQLMKNNTSTEADVDMEKVKSIYFSLTKKCNDCEV